MINTNFTVNPGACCGIGGAGFKNIFFLEKAKLTTIYSPFKTPRNNVYIFQQLRRDNISDACIFYIPYMHIYSINQIVFHTDRTFFYYNKNTISLRIALLPFVYRLCRWWMVIKTCVYRFHIRFCMSLLSPCWSSKSYERAKVLPFFCCLSPRCLSGPGTSPTNVSTCARLRRSILTLTWRIYWNMISQKPILFL